MRPFRSLFLQTVLILGFACAAQAQSVQRGGNIARANCSRCHSIERSGPSPFSEAPPFRTLHHKYPVETLEEALAEGISTGHPAMPEFALQPRPNRRFHRVLKKPRIRQWRV